MKLYLKYLSIHLKSQMQYKTSFIMTIIGQFATSFSALLSVYFLMNRFHKVRGFTFSEVLLCFAVILMAFSLAECFMRGFDTFSHILSHGEFDRIMVRPRNEMLQVLCSRIEFSKIGRLIQAVCVFVYAIPTSNIAWGPDKILILFLMILSGTVVFSGLFMIYASLCFFTTEGLEFMNIFTDGGREFGAYPLSVYGNKVLKFFTYVIPLALVQYYPFLYLTEKSTSAICFLAPIIACMFILPCYCFFLIGIVHYKSTGS